MLGKERVINRYEALRTDERLTVALASVNPAERTHEVTLTMPQTGVRACVAHTVHHIPELSLGVGSIKHQLRGRELAVRDARLLVSLLSDAEERDLITVAIVRIVLDHRL